MLRVGNAAFLVLSLLLIAAGCITIETQPKTQNTSQPTQPTTQQSAVDPPKIIAFNAVPSTITAGNSATLLWNVTGANVVTIDQGVGNVQPAGTLPISPATNITYTLNAFNRGGNTIKSVTVTVNPVSSVSPVPPLTPTSYYVTGVTASADPPSYSGPCPQTIHFYASIAVNGPCTVVYRWERSDGLVSPGFYNLTFPATGSQTVTADWTDVSSSGWAKLHVVTPNEVFSNQAFFVVNCTGTPSASSYQGWAGTWNTNWGTMYLTQSTGRVTGTYAYDKGKIEGSISKNLSGNILAGTWSESPSYAPPDDAGDIEFTLSPDGNSFTGKWRYGSSGDWDGTWTGTRVGP